jgi:hypothetical protein
VSDKETQWTKMNGEAIWRRWPKADFQNMFWNAREMNGIK